MKRQKVIFSIVALAMIAGTAVLLAVVPQKLGPPGVKASPVVGSDRWRIDLPDMALGFISTNHELDGKALDMLPKDTSFAEREYYRSDCPPICSSVILMGTDRTSIHKAKYCLEGDGVHIDRMTRETVRMYEPEPYDLPVIKIVGSQSRTLNGKKYDFRCVYVYWYVADGILSNDPSGFQRMWSMAKELMLTGTLQRWAYVRYYSVCAPGQEDATYERIKEMITTCVPQFQLTPKPLSATVAAQP